MLVLQAAFMKDWGITQGNKADFPFLANGQLWRHDKAQTADASDDWFGKAVMRPDLVLADMRAIVAPGQNSGHTFTFFRNIAENEKAESITQADCKGLTCSSWANQKALPVMQQLNDAGDSLRDVGAVAPSGGGGGGSGAHGVAAASGLAAVGAVLAALALAA